DVTGLLVPVKDAVALADAIQRLIEDSELRNNMGQAGRALAEEAFAIEKIVEQHMDIYRELLEP
ncbi:glycosyltransferase, partial [Streptomyces sp. P17]|uniref:glycosyltransferase n=1 Tax=Streptomyces sp. P17 TaxID=3074716 RepID=UPI0028F3F7A6